MDVRNCSVKTSPYIKEWMVLVDPPKGANMVKKKNEWQVATPLFKYSDTLH